MPARKKPPHKTIVRNLLASKKLSEGETVAFQQMVADFEAGKELTDHQKLWIETLNERHLLRQH